MATIPEEPHAQAFVSNESDTNMFDPIFGRKNNEEINIEQLGEVKRLDIGDIVEVNGHLFRCVSLYVGFNEVPALYFDSVVEEIKARSGDSNGDVEDDIRVP